MDKFPLIQRAAFAVAGLLLLLELKAKQRKERGLEGPSWTSKTSLLRSRVRTYCLSVLIIGVNILIIFMASFQKPNKDQSPNTIPGWLWPTVAFSIFGGGVCAWAALVFLQSDKYGKRLGIHVQIHQVKEDDTTRSTWHHGNGAALPVESSTSSSAREDADPDNLRTKADRDLEVQNLLIEAKKDGTNRRLKVTVSCTDQRMTTDH
jgi:hypothetical protein